MSGLNLILNNLTSRINNTFSLQVFQLVRFGTLFLISIIFAKSNLTTGQIGQYEIFIFLSGALTSFWVNGLIQSFLPLYKGNEIVRGKTLNHNPIEIFNAFVLLSFFSILVVFLLFTFKTFATNVLNNSNEIPFFNLLLLYIFFSCPCYIIEYIYLLKNKPKQILIYGFISFGMQFLFLAIPVILEGNLKFSIVGLLIISIIRYCWLLILLKQYSIFKISVPFLKEHIKCGYPLILSSLLGSAASYFDGFLVLQKFNASYFAIFRYGARELPLSLLLANAFGNSLIPEFSIIDNFKNALNNLKKKSERLMHFLFPITILFLLTSKIIYPVIFNKNFLESADIFNIYLLLVIVRLVFPHTIIIGLKKTGIIMTASLIELFVNMILSFILINLIGLIGVAIADVIAYGIQKIIWIIYNKVRLKLSLSDYVPVPVFSLYSVITIITFLVIML